MTLPIRLLHSPTSYLRPYSGIDYGVELRVSLSGLSEEEIATQVTHCTGRVYLCERS